MAAVIQLMLPICFLLCLSCIGRSCIESERRALLDVRADMFDPDSWLSSWRQSEDCCSWRGVGCDNLTGHVTMLNLHSPYWEPGESKLSPSLFSLLRLKHLDLSMNDFRGAPIPENISSLVNLEYLNLSFAWFGGTIPRHLGNLSYLHSLDLSFNFGLRDDELQWLSQTTSLKYLDLSGVDLHQVGQWMDAINMLPSLSVLRLSGCGLSTITGVFANVHNNLTSLTVLDLSSNIFPNVPQETVLNLSSNRLPNVPQALGKLGQLEYLYLSRNMLGGEMPKDIGNLHNLVLLDLSLNQISGWIPNSIGSLANLQMLDISDNLISGHIPESLCNLGLLQSLDVSGNNISGQIPKAIGNLHELTEMDMSSNKIEGVIPESVGKLFNLNYLILENNMIRGEIPSSLWCLCYLTFVDLSFNRISGVASGLVDGLSICNGKCDPATRPSDGLQLWLGNNYIREFPEILGHVSAISYLNLSSNSMEGVLRESHFANLSVLRELDLSYNKLHGPIPNIYSSWLNTIYLSGNSFAGPIPLSFTIGQNIRMLALSQNRLNGTMPLSLCNMTSLMVLDLSDNNLVGKLPSCLNMLNYLVILDLTNNSLTGQIPDLNGTLVKLQSLHLRNNDLFGRIPESLKYCNRLVILDLGENRLSGPIPMWIGESLSLLKVLSLRWNQFGGSIPRQLAYLSSLQVLDLSHNNLSGIMSLPFGNFSAMTVVQLVDGSKFSLESRFYEENLWLNAKGTEIHYFSVLSAVTSIDISDNNLWGGIPRELTQLLGLHFLKLSRNHFTGNIPQTIGDMVQLESLDLSMNNLSGTIPLSMSRLLFLSHLNLSSNKLSGRIPSGNQLQTLDDPSIYNDNDGLCGPPLLPCRDDLQSNTAIHTIGEEDEAGRERIWICASGALGFVAGFWAFFGTLIIKNSVRYAYFRSVDRLYDWIYVALAVNYGRLKSMMAKRNN